MIYIIVPFIVGFLSQITKLIIEYFKYKKINISRLFDGMGGMPSTHSAVVSSLSTLIYLKYGINDITSITIIFSLIVIYDSMGIRFESGKQAHIINEIVGSKLKEKLGHSPIETLGGVLFGIVLTLIILYIH